MSRPMVYHVEQRGRHLDNIITRLGVDVSVFRRAAHGATFELARWNCVRCAHPSACEEWIETLGRGAQIPPHFCPNCELLRAYATKF
jgi:hypothetical protein